MSCLTDPIMCYAFYHDLNLRGLKRKKPLSNKLGAVQTHRLLRDETPSGVSVNLWLSIKRVFTLDTFITIKYHAI